MLNTTECKCQITPAPGKFGIGNLFVFIIIGSSLIFVGLIGNTIATVILSTKSFRSIHNLQLTTLITWNSILVVCFLVQYTAWFCNQSGNPIHCSSDSVTLLLYNYILINTSFAGSIVSLVVVTVQRHLVITKPYLYAHADQTTSLFRFSAYVSVFLPVLVNIHRYAEVTVRECCILGKDGSNIGQTSVLDFSDTAANPLFFILLRIGVDLLALYFLPLTVLAILTVKIHRSIHRADGIRHNLTHSASSYSNNEHSVDKTVIQMLLSFVLCYTIPAIVNFLELILPAELYHSGIVESGKLTGNLLVIFNSSMNFPILYRNGTKFRSETKRLISLCIRRTPTDIGPSSHDIALPTINIAADNDHVRPQPLVEAGRTFVVTPPGDTGSNHLWVETITGSSPTGSEAKSLLRSQESLRSGASSVYPTDVSVEST